MSLDLGELVGTLRMDVTPFDKALAHGEAALNTFASTAGAAAKGAGTAATDGLSKGLGGMDAEARSAGNDAGTALGAGLGSMDAEARSAGAAAAAALGTGLDGAEQEAADAGKEAGSRFSDEFKNSAKAGAAVAGAGVGAAITVGVVDNLSVEGGLNKMAVQLGLGNDRMKIAGQVAGQIYANNFGEDLPQINEAVANVVRNMNIGVKDANLQPITEQVLTLVDAFDQDLAMTTAGVGQMIRTGMVKDAQEGLDVLTAGLQGPANKADDLMETMNEYGTQFRKLGLNGADAVGLLAQGLQGGARDADIVADSLKEFSLRTQGATTQVQKLAGGETALIRTPLGDAMEAIGIKVLDMDNNVHKAGETFQKDLAGGGEKAKAALDKVLDGVQKIKDPAERTGTMVALFGTQAEDMGDALLKMDLDKTSKELGKVEGASQKAVDQMGSGAQATIDGYKRKLIDMGRGAIEATGPTAAIAAAVGAFGPAVLGVLGPVAQLVAARALQATAAGTGAAAETAASNATKAGWIRSAAASTVGALKMAASWLIAMGPIALVIAAVVGLVVLIVKNWDTIKEVTAKVWGWIVDTVTSVPEKLGAVAGKLKTKGKEFLQGLKDGAEEKWEAVKTWVGNVPDRFMNGLGNVTNKLKDKGKDFLQGLKDGAEDKWAMVVGWVTGIPERFLNNVGGGIGTLKEKGKDFLAGLREGAGEKWEDVRTWVAGIPERVLGALGAVGSILKDAGINIVAGFLAGLLEKWEDVKGKIGSWAKWIKDHKGPESYDKVLLRPAGRWIVQGLEAGFEDQMPSLEKTLDGITATIANTATPALNASTQPVDLWDDFYRTAPSPGGAGAAPQEWNIYETTNPQATAAEVSRRQAFAGAGA